MNQIIKSRPDLKVLNLDQLPKGVGSRAKYLECITALDGALIAKQWRVTKPKEYDVLVALKGSKEYTK